MLSLSSVPSWLNEVRQTVHRWQYGPSPESILAKIQALRTSGSLAISDSDFVQLQRTIPEKVQNYREMRFLSLEYRIGNDAEGVVATLAAHLSIINHVWPNGVELSLPEGAPNLLLGDHSHVPSVRWVWLEPQKIDLSQRQLAADQFLSLLWLRPDLVESRLRYQPYLLALPRCFKSGGYSWEGSQFDLYAFKNVDRSLSVEAKRHRGDYDDRNVGIHQSVVCPIN